MGSWSRNGSSPRRTGKPLQSLTGSFFGWGGYLGRPFRFWRVQEAPVFDLPAFQLCPIDALAHAVADPVVLVDHCGRRHPAPGQPCRNASRALCRVGVVKNPRPQQVARQWAFAAAQAVQHRRLCVAHVLFRLFRRGAGERAFQNDESHLPSRSARSSCHRA